MLCSYPSGSLSGGLILPFLAQSWTHAGSGDPFLYQHRARCTLGASQCPLSAPAAQTQVCVDSPDTDHILQLPDWAWADSGVCRRGYACINMCVFMCWRLCVRDQIHEPSLLPRESGGLSLQRTVGPWDPSQPTRQRRKSCLWQGLAWQQLRLTLQPDTVANATVRNYS